MDALLHPNGPYMREFPLNTIQSFQILVTEIFECIAASWAVLTWVWASVLYVFPNSQILVEAIPTNEILRFMLDLMAGYHSTTDHSLPLLSCEVTFI